MTASDPAVAAASRATRDEDDPSGFAFYDNEVDAMIEAAREALAPLRELHRPNHPAWGSTTCVTCELNLWPCATAKLIYPEEEL
ncbi:hypothetical protein [Tsukamurella tyrosinosolvens]|uniref:hypothetical protein n=1 Tax=Tsukamurella tyrosinosolvens TaxID=57704 RepID=UPI002DD423F7|nr:hypothetical protein [Tsukamurella tyrosinosolvens]MEC4616314.1 hypothetical protein [Tsukamurella tyrosinosolvens]